MPGQFITRHSVRGMGELYLLQLPLVILGFLYLFFKKEKKILLLLALWIVLYPLGSMLTIDKSVQATRSIIGVIPFQIFSAIGLWLIFNIFYKAHNVVNYFYKGIIIFIILFSFINYLNLYFTKYSLYSSDFWGWQYGARDIVKYFVANEGKYDDLVMIAEFNAPEIFFKFYAPQNCIKCRVGTPDALLNQHRKQLFAVTPTYLVYNPYRFLTKKLLYYPNGNVAFQIGEIVQ